MPRLNLSQTSEPRKGVILMVVIILLTLFAVVGLTFYLYSGSEETSSRIFREAYNIDDLRPDESIKELLNFSLGQLIYDTNDQINPWSGIRGWSLGRDIYGWNSDSPGTNIYPFNGTGRLHTSATTTPSSLINPFGIDDFLLINYTAFLSDGFIRDPERYGGARTSLTQALFPYTGGWNPSYTYPDANHLYLAAVKADGTLLMPSFHRTWLFNTVGGTTYAMNDPTNPNWTNPQGKYLTLRPRPFDNDPTFPLPGDATGDVKNLIGAPGGNDSIWVDLGYPVKVGPDGTKYKPLFAFLIMDLDNRLNINVAGNVRGAGNMHLSNLGLGTWERNPAKMVAPTDPNYAAKTAEWANLITGVSTPKVVTGRYGKNGTFDGVPQPLWAPGPDVTFPGLLLHAGSQLDFDGCNDGPGGAATAQITLPAMGSYTGVPSFPAGYYNGCSNGGMAPPLERQNHPALFDFLHPGLTWTGQQTDDKVFDISNMKSMVVGGYSGTDYKNTELGQLLPLNLADSRMRGLITTHSFDVDQPGPTPWIYDQTSLAGNGNYTVNTTTDTGSVPSPYGNPVGFPALSQRTNTVPTSSEFSADWRWNLQTASKILKRVDLNRFLPPYPHMGQGLTPATYNNTPMVTAPNLRFDQDAPNGKIYTQFLAAQNARQQLADDIYRVLLKVTGVVAPAAQASPTQAELMPRRWLAQLAVNIVDFIDEDDISTPFNYYGVADGLAPGNLYASPTGDAETLQYWVFGTELPRVVLNEVLAEYTQTPLVNPTNYNLYFYAELVNPTLSPSVLPATQAGSLQPLDAQPVQLYMPSLGAGGSTVYSPYRVEVNGFTAPHSPLLDTLGWNCNVMGTPDTQVLDPAACKFLCGTSDGTDSRDFTQLPVTNQVGQTNVVPSKGKPVNQAVPTVIYPQGSTAGASYFLVGSGTPDANWAIDASTGVPPSTPYMQSGPKGVVDNLTWPPQGGAPLTPLPTQLNFFLRRLANPYLPPGFQPNASQSVAPNNMYMTVDTMTNIAAHLNQPNPNPPTYATSGKQQPYASDNGSSQIQNQTLRTAQATPAVGTTTNSFGSQNQSAAPQPYFDWLFHADRQLISPMELLQVSGYRPHELTQAFITTAGKFMHRVPWFDQTGLPNSPPSGQSCRLWRLFEFLECHDRYTGVSVGGRIPGKMNINTFWDPEVWRAVCDGQSSNFFTTTPSTGDVDQVYTNMVNQRTPGLLAGTGLSAGDHPFLSTGVGNVAAGNANDPFAPTTGTSINNTIFAAGSSGRLLQAPSEVGAAHPTVQYELMNKIYNNLTTRSNVFAVFITVGYFQVLDDTVRPAKLGPEIGLPTNQNIRHRLFAIVDRTNLTLVDTTNLAYAPAVTTLKAAVAAGAQQLVTFQTTGGTTTPPSNQDAAIPWQIQAGSTLVIDTGANQETVIISAPSPGTFAANFQRNHSAGAAVYIPGNPGPQSLFDVQDPKYSPVVPYFAVLQ